MLTAEDRSGMARHELEQSDRALDHCRGGQFQAPFAR
jgi:hypothetical protein